MAFEKFHYKNLTEVTDTLKEQGYPLPAREDFSVLATPITIQLTPHEVNSQLGQNIIWADTGDTEVEYRASTKMYIDRKITEAVSALS